MLTLYFSNYSYNILLLVFVATHYNILVKKLRLMIILPNIQKSVPYK